VGRIQKAWGRLLAVAPFVPIALACLAGAVFGRSPVLTVFFSGFAFATARPTLRWWIGIAIVAVVVAWRSEVLESPVQKSLASSSSEFVDGVLTVGRKSSPTQAERFGVLDEDGVKRKVIVLEAEGFRPGEVRRIQGKFFVPSRERNPGLFPRIEFWERDGVYGALWIEESALESVDWSSAPYRWAEGLREKLSVSITRGLPAGSSGRDVIMAMVLGEKPPRNSEISTAFRESGAMHVFAVSGLHVTLVGAIFWMVLMHLPIPRRVGVFLVILAMMTYALVTGLRPPAVRATLMAVCFLGAFFFRRRPSVFNALALSFALVVFWKPSQVFDVGFQLSYGVLLAIGAGVGIALKLTGKIAELDPFFPSQLLSDGQRKVLNVRTYFANLGASSLAAWLGSMPIMIWHFGIVTPVAVLTSLLLIPATMVILALAFFAALVGALDDRLGAGVNRVNGGVASSAFYIAKGFSKVPLGHWRSRRLTPGDWVVFDTHDGGSASFLDVQGGAMIDVGSERFFTSELRPILRRWETNPTLAFLTHPDGDHVGALPEMLNEGMLSKVISPVGEALSPGYREFFSLAKSCGCEAGVGKTGERIDLADEVWVEILCEGEKGIRNIADNRNMVMKVHWKGWKILVTGDLGMVGELDLIARGIDLTADIVLMGHHEWGFSGQHQFLEASGAEVVISSGASYPGYEMPRESWTRHLKEEGYHLFNQWETGSVIMDFSDEEATIRAYLDDDRRVVLQR
jgi:ComEC/Rec2-related protein